MQLLGTPCSCPRCSTIFPPLSPALPPIIERRIDISMVELATTLCSAVLFQKPRERVTAPLVTLTPSHTMKKQHTPAYNLPSPWHRTLQVSTPKGSAGYSYTPCHREQKSVAPMAPNVHTVGESRDTTESSTAMQPSPAPPPSILPQATDRKVQSMGTHGGRMRYI